MYAGNIRKIILLACLTFSSTSEQQQNVQKDVCGLRSLKYYLQKSKQGISGDAEQTELTERENFPLHVSIFRRASKTASFAYECGGTLIPGAGKDLLVLTAASCVTENLKSPQHDPEFSIVVGPTSSNYETNSQFSESQIFAIKTIEINPLYEPVGLKSDAALIHLDGEYAQPVCLPPNNIVHAQVKFGMVGKIAGFNLDTKSNVSEKLWFAKHSVTTGAVCENKLQLKVNEFLEFCTANQKETNACQEDSGSGLVFQFPQKNGEYYVQPKLFGRQFNIGTGRGFADYRRDDPKPSAFTQMVWRGTTELGIGTATDGATTTVVTQYNPRGNVFY